MARSLYVASLEPHSGKSMVALGLTEMLSERVGEVGYLRPVVPVPDDDRIELIRSRLGDGPDHDRARALFTDDEIDDAVGAGRLDTLVSRVLDAYHELDEVCDFVLVDGTDHTGVSAAIDLGLDTTLASDLGAPVLLVVRGADRDLDGIRDAVAVARERMRDEGVTLAATVVNRVPDDLVDEVRAEVDRLDGEPVYVVPQDADLGAPTVAEVVDAIGATPISAGQGSRGTIAKHPQLDDQRPVRSVKVAAMTLPNALEHFEDGTLVVTPGDREDVLLGALLARVAPSTPNVAGIVLTGGLTPDPRIVDLLAAVSTNVPVVTVEEDTFAAAQAVGRVRGVIRAHHEYKIAAALDVFREAVDLDTLAERIEVAAPDRVTPRMFEHRLIERASSDRRRIVLPEGTDERILQATAILLRRKVADLVLLGDAEEIRAAASDAGVDVGVLDDVALVDPGTDDRSQRFAEEYVRLREHKGVTHEQAADVMTDVSYFGTMMVHLGEADGMVSGAAHTTAHTIRPAFEFIRTRPGVDSVSSVFLMALADRVLVYGDCAVIPNPTVEQLADIAVSSADTARTFGIDPVVAMLSYSTGSSGTGEDVERVRDAVRLVRERAPDLEVEGPIQYDAAVDAGVAQAKLPESSVAGKATVFVFPDLDTGNTTYKAVQRSAGAVAIGPVLQGLNAPVNDLSRGCLVPDVVNTVAITAIQAQEQDG